MALGIQLNREPNHPVAILAVALRLQSCPLAGRVAELGWRQQKSAKVYFLGVGDKATDPSDEFMKRLADHKPPVRKASASHFVLGKGLLNTKTGERGLAFRATTIKWISDTEVEVSGGYYEAELSSSGNTYTVKKENGKWKVTKEKMDWIS